MSKLKAKPDDKRQGYQYIYDIDISQGRQYARFVLPLSTPRAGFLAKLTNLLDMYIVF